jgi:hypothetical protein
MLKTLVAVVILAPLWLCAEARSGAADTDFPRFQFGGFGTLGLVHSSEDKADFTSNQSKPNGAGYSREWSEDVDSLIAAQVTAQLTPQLSAVLQVISEQNYDNTYRPHVEWANLKYQATPDFSVRAGRTALPVFLISDTRKIGYANPSVRPPLEVYDLLPISSNDGIDASYRLRFGAAENTVQIIAGRSDSRFPTTGVITARTRHVAFVADTFERGFLLVHASYGQARLTIDDFSPLFDAFRQFGAMGAAIADKYSVEDRRATFIGVGATYDPHNWFATAEWGHLNTNSVLGNKSGWYASGGFRIGRFTPYAIHAAVRADSNTADPGLSVAALPPSVAATAAGLNGALNSILGSAAEQRTDSLGLRWDSIRSFALTMQFDRIHLGAASPGFLVNLQPGFQRGGALNIVTAVIDFVW